MYLADTNIFLEALLHQHRTNEVRSFLQAIDLSPIFMTDLSLHSIGIILFRLKKFARFIGLESCQRKPPGREINATEYTE